MEALKRPMIRILERLTDDRLRRIGLPLSKDKHFYCVKIWATKSVSDIILKICNESIVISQFAQ